MLPWKNPHWSSRWRSRLFRYYNRRKANHQNNTDYISGASKICRPKRLAFSNCTQRHNESTTDCEARLWNTTKRSKYSVIKESLLQGRRDRLCIDLRIKGPERTNSSTLQRRARRETSLKYDASEQSTRRLPTTSIKSHSTLCQPGGRRAGKSRDT